MEDKPQVALHRTTEIQVYLFCGTVAFEVHLTQHVGKAQSHERLVDDQSECAILIVAYDVDDRFREARVRH